MKPLKPTLQITDAEWAIMTVVWERAPVTVTTLTDTLHARRRWSPGTIRTLLRRLVNKGALERRPEGKAYLYTPCVTMKQCARQASETFLDRVLGRATSVSILHLVKKAELSNQDIQDLRQILNEKEKKQ